MTGRWSQRAVVDLAASAGYTHSITSPRKQWLLVGHGEGVSGTNVEGLFVRLNGDSAANYHDNIHYYIEGGAHNVAAADLTGFRVLHHSDDVAVQWVFRLTRSGARWLYKGTVMQRRNSGGLLEWIETWGAWPFNVNINTIAFLFVGGAGAGRFNGQISLWSSDD